MNWFGIGATFLYIFTVIFFRWESFSALKIMPLNEFGDFFAGVFGPLMLFWLILGYIQQQKELKQNTEALELQAQELMKSVEQHKELVKTTQQQLEVDRQLIELENIKHKRESEPDLVLTSAKWSTKGSNGIDYIFAITNAGNPASFIRFKTQPIVSEIDGKPPLSFLGKGEKYNLKVNIKNPPRHLDFLVSCKDSNKYEHEKTFNLILDDEYRYEFDS